MNSPRTSFQNFKTGQVGSFIDQILDNPPLEGDFYDRILWIKSIFDWMRKESPFQNLFRSSRHQVKATRFKYVLQLLERDETRTENFRKIFQKTLQEISARDAFCQLGLPSQLSFFGEFFQRFGNIVLPREPVDNSLLSLLHWIFPDEEDADWMESIDSDSVEKVFQLIGTLDLPKFENDRQDALLILSSFLRSIGLSYDVRRIISKTSEQRLTESPFYRLQTQIESRLNPNEIYLDSNDLHLCIDEVRDEVNKIYKYFETYGVSIDLVYQMERASKYLNRIEELLKLSHVQHRQFQDIFLFLALLIRDNITAKGVKGFVRQNISLLSKRIVRTNSKIGEHYISRTKAQLVDLLRKATGGGVITIITVYNKIFLSGMGGAPFIQGLMSSLNYMISFVGIQLAHFTLASKQPASTAPALAEQIGKLEDSRKLVTELIQLIRSQIVSVFGNALGVIPGVVLIGYVYRWTTGDFLISEVKAKEILESHEILGPTIIFAAFTGVLLFLASIIAGMVDNWFTYRRLRRSIARNETLIHAFGKLKTRKISEFISGKMSGLASNIALGFLLGMTPEILKFIGLPLEVRHVTLAIGTVAAAIPTLEFSQLFSWQMIQFPIVLALVGVFNVGVSFSLALMVALRANETTIAISSILKDLMKEFSLRPLNFFWDFSKDRSEQ